MSRESSKPGREPIQFGKYKVLVRIGKGGMGTVYKAVDTDLDRIVALKIMAPEIAARPNMLLRFRQEARSAARLRHDNIVAIFDFGEVQGTWYLALEYVDGRDLQEHIYRQGRLSPEEARALTIQAARALEHAHQQGIIHRDIKPSNFLLTQVKGRPLLKLTDLGLALHQEEEQARITKDHATVGTVDYMPPEQAYDSRASDIRSDIYSLGCTLYHMLAGHCPFPKGSIAERVICHLKKDPPDIRTLNEIVPDDLAAILHRMLAKKPADRYQTPAELLADLEGTGPEPNPLAPRPRKEKAPNGPVDKAPGSAETNQAASASDASRPRKKKRSSAEARKVRRSRGPTWVPYAVAGGAAVLLGLGIWSISRPGSSVPAPSVVPSGPPSVPPVLAKKDEDPPPKKSSRPPFVGPKGPILRAALAPRASTASLYKRFLGPFEKPETIPADAVVRKCCRSEIVREGFEPFAEALAETAPGTCTILEIHDDGPFFVKHLPEIRDRHVVLRPGPGFRPFLIWDTEQESAAEVAEKGSLLQVRQGRLDLLDLDFAVWFPDAKAESPRSLLHLHGAMVVVARCTFSQGGKGTAPATLVRTEDHDGTEPGVPCLVRMSQSHVRGAGWNVLVGAGNQDVLIEDCLLVGGDSPLVRTTNRGTTTLRLARSTLVARQDLLEIQGQDRPPGKTALKLSAWDCLLARCAPLSPSGDLLRVEGADAKTLVECRFHNVLYAGWKRLLHAPDGTILPGALDQWRARWKIEAVDGETIETWPEPEPTALEFVPAGDFDVRNTPAAFASTGGAGPLGCPVDLLPAAPRRWDRLTHQARVPMEPPLPDLNDPPEIPPAVDGVWHGETVDLAKTDLDRLLAQRLSRFRPGPRVVLRLVGKGTVALRPVKVRGLPHLVLHADRPAPGREPLILQVLPSAATEGAALFDVEGGNLDLRHLRIRFPNERTAPMPPTVLRVRGGSLRAQGCRLEGPTTNPPDYFRSLIDWGTGGAESCLVLEDSVLSCGKTLVEVRGAAPRILIRDGVLLGGEDGLRHRREDGSARDGWCRLENVTVALKGALWDFPVHGQEPDPMGQPFLVRIERCWLTRALEPPTDFCLVRASAADLAGFPLIWQGEENGYETGVRRHLLRTFEREKGADEKAWRHFWGPLGDRAAVEVKVPAKASALLLDRPDWTRLLPPEVPGSPRLGADPVRLGLVPRK